MRSSDLRAKERVCMRGKRNYDIRGEERECTREVNKRGKNIYKVLHYSVFLQHTVAFCKILNSNT